MTSAVDLAAAQAHADQAAAQADNLRAAAEAEFEHLQAERRDRERDQQRQRLTELRQTLIPAARADRDRAAQVVAAAILEDPLAAALLNAVHTAIRYFSLQVDANGLAGAIGEPQRETSPSDAVAPDPLLLLSRVLQQAARDAVEQERAVAADTMEAAISGNGALPLPPPVDHEAETFAERRRAYQDHRMETLLGYTGQKIATLTEAQRTAALARATDRENELQQQQRELFDGARSPHGNTTGFRPVHG